MSSAGTLRAPDRPHPTRPDRSGGRWRRRRVRPHAGRAPLTGSNGDHAVSRAPHPPRNDPDRRCPHDQLPTSRTTEDTPVTAWSRSSSRRIGLRHRRGSNRSSIPSTSSAPLGGTPVSECNTSAEPAVRETRETPRIHGDANRAGALVCVHPCTVLCAPHPNRCESRRQRAWPPRRVPSFERWCTAALRDTIRVSRQASTLCRVTFAVTRPATPVH